mmetsp:Transcript_17541/g.61670  ORF Transcript_17541/g.61670 Transcript_17541/m.61670 type:complete len:404 (-) Transcript_17541:343-1554(-)
MTRRRRDVGRSAARAAGPVGAVYGRLGGVALALAGVRGRRRLGLAVAAVDDLERRHGGGGDAARRDGRHDALQRRRLGDASRREHERSRQRRHVEGAGGDGQQVGRRRLEACAGAAPRVAAAAGGDAVDADGAVLVVAARAGAGAGAAPVVGTAREANAGGAVGARRNLVGAVPVGRRQVDADAVCVDGDERNAYGDAASGTADGQRELEDDGHVPVAADVHFDVDRVAQFRAELDLRLIVADHDERERRRIRQQRSLLVCGHAHHLQRHAEDGRAAVPLAVLEREDVVPIGGTHHVRRGRQRVVGVDAGERADLARNAAVAAGAAPCVGRSCTATSAGVARFNGTVVPGAAAAGGAGVWDHWHLEAHRGGRHRVIQRCHGLALRERAHVLQPAIRGRHGWRR